MWGAAGFVLSFLLVLALAKHRVRKAWKRRMVRPFSPPLSFCLSAETTVCLLSIQPIHPTQPPTQPTQAKDRPVYSADAILGNMPLPGAKGHLYDSDDEREEEEDELEALPACSSFALPPHPLLSSVAFYQSQDYELDRSRRSLDASRRSSLDRSR